MGDLLASVPYRLGYRLEGSNQLAIQLKRPGGRYLVVLDWQSNLPIPEAATQAAAAVRSLAAATAADSVLILGYRPDAAQRVYALREAARADGATMPIAAIQVDDNQWRMFGVGVTSDWNRMPEVPVSTLLEGYPAPAKSLQDYRRLYDPLPEPTYGHLPDNSRELIGNAPPGIQAELATRALHRIAERNPNPLDLPALARTLTVPAVSHHIAADALDDRARTSALVDASRGAPADQRPAVAAAAATALWFRGQAQEAQQVIGHIPDDSYFATTGRHLRGLIQHHVDPRPHAPAFKDAVSTQMLQAEASWANEQPAPATTDPLDQLRPLPRPDIDGPML